MRTTRISDSLGGSPTETTKTEIPLHRSLLDRHPPPDRDPLWAETIHPPYPWTETLHSHPHTVDRDPLRQRPLEGT